MASLLLRSAALTAAASGALLAPQAAGAATNGDTASAAKAGEIPKVLTVRPTRAAIGGTLTIRGHDFAVGKRRNTVVFRRTGRRAVFAKSTISTRKLVKVVIPASLGKYFVQRRGRAIPTRFQIGVLSTRFVRRFTSVSRSPLIASASGHDCDGDGRRNSIDPDDDNDLLVDTDEVAVNAKLAGVAGLRMDPCDADTDGDDVEDGFEFRSARDLNSSFYQPYPGKRPYPNPLDGKDGKTDFDGDGLTLSSEQRLWRYELARTGRPPSLESLSYSDGTQYSIYRRDGAGRRESALAAEGYDRQADFRTWLAASGHGTVSIPGDSAARSIFDLNRDGAVSPEALPGYPTSENLYYDMDQSGTLSDDERDEDADGLMNIDETLDEALRFRLDPRYWTSLYPLEKPFKIAYVGTDFADPDADGDGVRDGADDQDFDDVPNLMELSRQMASGRPLDGPDDPGDPDPSFGRVNPFNPCLPYRFSRTCPRYVPFEGAWAPYDDSPDYSVRN